MHVHIGNGTDKDPVPKGTKREANIDQPGKNARRFSTHSTPYILFPMSSPYFIAFPSISTLSFSIRPYSSDVLNSTATDAGETLKPRVNFFEMVYPAGHCAQQDIKLRFYVYSELREKAGEGR